MKSNERNMETFQNCSNLSKKDKRSTVARLKSNFNTSPEDLYAFLSFLLPITKNISDPDSIEWCKWLIAGGLTPEVFAKEVKKYDNATTCGLVWTANFVAYRCRTCGISPCMSLCAECFQRGNHEGHDFNMFRSQAGGACDCGDIFVMKETGFCGRHGPQAQEQKPTAPVDLLLLPHAMMPRLIFRLMQHLRSYPATAARLIDEADNYLSMLQEFSALGAAVRTVMTQAITDPEVYKELTEWYDPGQSHYQNALESLSNPSPPDEYKDCPSLQETLVHKTFLEELMFWTVKLEFPQKVVCLLLNMLPDPDYKEALTRSFVLHYSRIPMMLEKSASPDTLSNRVVHVSVQLFSNEGLALRMTEQLSLLHVMVVSLKYMMSKILIPNLLHDPDKNFHFVVDCGKQVMKEHCYWPLVSDLNNVLSHRPVALKFMSDPNLLEMWFAFLAMFQGMNVNQRELKHHVEFEPSTYYAAFSAELEASAYPMWALVSHLKDASTVELTKSVLASCISALQEWFDAIHIRDVSTVIRDYNQVSFHLPLHRYLAILMSQAIKCQGVALKDVLPPNDVLELVYQHPLRLQVAFYEILNGMWVRNGLQIKGQMMTYIQCNFCNSMVDADLYLLQVCATQIDPERFIINVLEMFRVIEGLSIAILRTSPPFTCIDHEFEASMLESCLTFLATLIDVRSNLGANETWLSKLEMVTLLCMGDKTHSQLMELMPERCGTGQSRDFDSMLTEVADYRAPNNMQQGMYAPKSQVWEDLYDPIHVLLRAVHRRDFQTSMDRFTEYVQQTRKLKPGSENVWPPLRPPSPCGEPYEDPRKILQSRIFHAMIFCILYQAVERRNISEHVLALTIYLLEMAVMSCPLSTPSQFQLCQEQSEVRYDVRDRDLASFYETDWLALNVRTVIVNQVNLVSKDRDSSDGEDNEPGLQDEILDMEVVPFDSGARPEEMDVEVIELPSTSQSSPAASTSSLLQIIPRTVNRPRTAISSLRTLALRNRNQTYPDSQGTNQIWPMLLRSISSPSRALSIVPVASTSKGTKSFSSSQTKEKDFEMGAEMTEMNFKVGESIISLLLKLHEALSGTPDSYVIGQQRKDGLLESRIGDGPFFVAKVLDRIAELDDSCRECIKETKARLWPLCAEEQGSEAKAKEEKEREERRRRAKERQQRLIEEFANKQKQFMEKTKETEDAQDMDWNETSEKKTCEYDCVICNQSSPSTADQPMGLVVLLQATAVLGHMKKDSADVSLPTSEEERASLPSFARSEEFDKRMEILENEFDPSSWQLGVNVGWDAGVHVQTCGHHIHLNCLSAYLHSLKGQQRPHSPAVDKGEYLCPLCRQLANSVLPLAADLGELTAVVRARPLSLTAQIQAIDQLLNAVTPTAQPSQLDDAMHKSMQDVTNLTAATPLRLRYRSDPTTHFCLFMFVSSIARTNLEVEMIQKGGAFLTSNVESPLIPKRSCIVPLLHMLAIHGRLLTWPSCTPWKFLTECPKPDDTSVANLSKEMPLLLHDPTTLLIQLLLLLPLNLDQSYFSCVVKCLYNLLYFQVLTQISLQMTDQEKESWRDPKCCSCMEVTTLDAAMGFVLSLLEGTKLYVSSSEKFEMSSDATPSCSKTCDAAAPAAGPSMAPSGQSDTGESSGGLSNRSVVEKRVQALCLPFLRIATLLRHHLFSEEIPEVRTPQTEFVRLVYYLELVTEGMDWGKFNASVALNFADDGLLLPRNWLRQLISSVNWCNAASLMKSLHNIWFPPRLLSLPQLYDRIFQFYHARQCRNCNSVPREASLCLLCGTLVCLKENCCKEGSVCEAVEHASNCGAGTAMFLVVTSSYVIVIRGKRACLWGSVYLDSFGEEDRELKRGKPLYLCPERYRLLQEQWLAHRFDHTNKKWVWHRDAL